MQAPVLRRAMLNQFAGLALIVGLAASLALNVALFTRSSGESTQPAAVHVHSIGPAQGRFFESRMDRRDAHQALMDQIEASRNEAEHATAVANWGRFVEERNARIDAAAGR